MCTRWAVLALLCAPATSSDELTVTPAYADVRGGQPLLLTLGSAAYLDLEQPHCIIGGQKVAAVPLAGGAQLSCTAVPAPNLQPGAVTISTDAAPTASTSLTYYDESILPQLSAVLPRSSRAASASLLHVFGSNFAPLGHTLQCAFGSDGLSRATFVSPTELVCSSPASTAATHSVVLAVTLDGNSFSGDNAVEEEAVVFTTSDGTTAPSLTKLTPNLGALEAGTLIDVTGSHFAPVDGATAGDGLVCKFGELQAVRGPVHTT